VQGVSKSDRSRRTRKRLARRLRVGTAVALLALAACTDNAGPSDTKKAQAATPRITVKLEATGGMRASDAALLSELIATEAARPGMPFATGTQHTYAIGGAVDAGGTS